MTKVPLRCPACDSGMSITQLTCPSCDTRVEGAFALSPVVQLTSPQLQFVEVFLRCRGNIREVEKELGISYPTVRSRLDEIVQSLGYQPAPIDETDHMDTIRQFELGTLTFDEALEKMRKG